MKNINIMAVAFVLFLHSFLCESLTSVKVSKTVPRLDFTSKTLGKDLRNNFLSRINFYFGKACVALNKVKGKKFLTSKDRDLASNALTNLSNVIGDVSGQMTDHAVSSGDKNILMFSVMLQKIYYKVVQANARILSDNTFKNYKIAHDALSMAKGWRDQLVDLWRVVGSDVDNTGLAGGLAGPSTPKAPGVGTPPGGPDLGL